MNRTHAEPYDRTGPCPGCDLPADAVEREHVAQSLPEGQYTWTLCETCGNETCPELRRLAAKHADRREWLAGRAGEGAG